MVQSNLVSKQLDIGLLMYRNVFLYMKKILLLIFFCGCILSTTIAQEIVVDTVSTPPPTTIEVVDARWPQPKKALMWSIIPGGGQIYNKRWWKTPIIYTAFAVDVYFIIRNTNFYNDFNQRVIDKRAGGSGDAGISLNSLIINRDLANKRRQQAYLGLFAIYVLQSAEAFTDAHLRHFDVSDDLSFTIQPKVETMAFSQGMAYGLGMTIPLIKSK